MNHEPIAVPEGWEFPAEGELEKLVYREVWSRMESWYNSLPVNCPIVFLPNCECGGDITFEESPE